MLFENGKFSKIQRYLKSITKSHMIPSETFLDQKIANTRAQKAELFNTHFQTVFRRNANVGKAERQDNVLLNSINFTIDEIEDSLNELHVNTANGPDMIGNTLLKNLSKSLPKSLYFLFNLISNKAIFPTKWKISEIAPIFKDGDKQDVPNYRQISLLSAVSKLLEKLIFEKLAPIVYPTLTPDQHGFRPKRSTITNLIDYLHEIFSCLDLPNCNYLNTFYLDFQKEFDKVSHGILMKKLSTSRIGGNCLSLIHNYLSNRKQTVRLNDTISGELEVFSGVPQGSILGPLFCLDFINDLPSCVMSATFDYADDYKIVGDNPLTLNIDVRRLWRWCEENCMSMNLTKSKVLCIKGSATIALPNYSFETTEVMKDLGILITDTLSWTQHA